jgi:predicted N-formylglutamate amidohydrolase
METHWAIDLGARALTLDLARRLGAPAVLARFNRLLCDANRPEQAPDLCRPEVEGHTLSFNREVDETERERRLARFHRPYHARIDQMLRESRPQLLFSVHTFTPRYLDQVREVQLGVLFDLHDALGARLATLLEPTGLVVEQNAPWSGKAGLAYSPDRHGRAAGIPYLELEVRHDLLTTPDRVTAIGAAVAEALRAMAEDPQLRAEDAR